MSSCAYGCTAARQKVIDGLKQANAAEVINGLVTGVQIVYAKYVGKTQVIEINQTPQSANVVDVSGATQGK